MSITSPELNYLIWRYLQESGFATTAFSLQDESKCNQLDEAYAPHVPIGALVSLTQRGVLYCEADELVNEKGEIAATETANRFTLVRALLKERDLPPELCDVAARSPAAPVAQPSAGDDFIAVVDSVARFAPAAMAAWSPARGTLAVAGADAQLWHVPRREAAESGHTAPAPAPLQPTEPGVAHVGGIEPRTLEPGTDDVQTFEPCTLFHAGGAPVCTCAWAPTGAADATGAVLATALEAGELRLWDAFGKLRHVLLLHRHAVVAVSWNATATHLASLDAAGKLVVWDAVLGAALYESASATPDAAASATAPATASATASATLDAVTGMDTCWLDPGKLAFPGAAFAIQILLLLPAPAVLTTLAGHTATIGTLSYAPQSQHLLSGSDAGEICLWSGLSTAPVCLLAAHTQPVVYAKWYTHDLFISAALDGAVKVWTDKGRAVGGGLAGVGITCAEVLANRRWLATGGVDGDVKVWDLSDILQGGDATRHGVPSLLLRTVAVVQAAVERPVLLLTWEPASDRFAVCYGADVPGAIVEWR